MKGIYQIREEIIKFYKRNEKWMNIMLKFVVGLIMFSAINAIGGENKLNSAPVIILLSILTVVLPISLISFLAIIMIVMQLVFVSLELSIVVGIFLMCIQLFYIRVFPKESILIFMMVLAYYLKVPYSVVFIGAIFFGFSSIVPVAIGTFLWYCIPIAKDILSNGGTTIASVAAADLLEMPSAFAEVFITIVTKITTDQTWIISIIVFAMIIALVYMVAQLEAKNSVYLAIGVGSIFNILGFILANMVEDITVGIIGLIISTLFSAIIVAIVQFFTRVLDYASAEKVQFEDDEFYYYVKAIPKILVAKPRKH